MKPLVHICQYKLKQCNLAKLLILLLAVITACPVPDDGTFTQPVAPVAYYQYDVYTYQCIYGYQPSGSMQSACLSNGTWSLQPPVCESKP